MLMTIISQFFLVAKLAVPVKTASANLPKASNGIHAIHPKDAFSVLSVTSSDDHRSLIYIEGVSVYECDPPLGPLRENFHDDDESPTGVVCYNNIATCCGPLLEFTSCSDVSTDPWPGAFVNGVCSGYSAFDCCYAEDGYTKWKFSACYDSQEKILANWDNNTNTCSSTSVSNCCGTRKEYTSCSGSSQRFPGKWTNDVCSGFSEYDCCFTEDYFTKHNFIACYEDQEMIEGKWGVDGDCYATQLSDCCRFTDTTVGSPSAPTVGPVSFRSPSAPTPRPVSSANRNAPTLRPASRVSLNAPAPSGDDNAAGVVIGIVVGLLVVAGIVAFFCFLSYKSQAAINGATNGGKPPSTNQVNNSVTKPSSTFLDASESGTTTSTNSRPEKTQPAFSNSATQNPTVQTGTESTHQPAKDLKKLSTAVKIASTLFFGAPVGLEDLGLDAVSDVVNAVNVISDVAETVENVTSSINNVAEIANLAFEEEEFEI